MAGPVDPEFVQHFHRTALNAIESHGLQLDASGEAAISDLAERAAETVDDHDGAKVQRAEGAFERLAVDLADQAAAEADLLVEPASAPRIEDAHVKKALLRFCPGFFPFC